MTMTIVKTILRLLMFGFAITGLQTGCVASSDAEKSEDSEHLLDKQLRALQVELPLSQASEITIEIPSINSAEAQLGKQLYFSTALSGDFDVACVSCHHPLLGGGDDLAQSIGVEALDAQVLGPGRQHRDGEFNVPRNAPTIFNIALWQRSMFWDSRVEHLSEPDLDSSPDSVAIRTPESRYGTADRNSLHEMVATQSFFPVTSIDEMRGDNLQFGMANDAVRLHLAARLGDYGVGQGEITPNPWPERFAATFARPSAQRISYAEIALALSAYQRSQWFVETPWERYLAGDNGAIPEAAKRGALLFYQTADQGGAGCARCHSGPFFTNEQHYALGTPQIGTGKNNGPDETDDFGRARETRNFEDVYKFRTPTLLNIAVTEPYYHAGSVGNLREVIEQHSQPESFAEQYLAEHAWCALPPFAERSDCVDLFPWAKANTDKALAAVQPSSLTPALTAAQTDDLLIFLQQLTDSCVTDAECLAPWMTLTPDQRDQHTLKPRLPALSSSVIPSAVSPAIPSADE